MTLDDMLLMTRDRWNLYGDGTAVQIFGSDPRYFGLTDYVVSSVVSGPSLILVPRVRINGGTR